MDIGLNLSFRTPAGFQGKPHNRASLPVSFLELCRDENLPAKRPQVFAYGIGCAQYMRQALCVYPVLGVTMSPEFFTCTAISPTMDKRLNRMRILRCKRRTSVSSVSCLLRMMLYWTLGAHHFSDAMGEFIMKLQPRVFPDCTASAASRFIL